MSARPTKLLAARCGRRARALPWASAAERTRVERIAAALNCSTRYLHKIFSEEDETISEYILRLRLEKCRGELSRANGRHGSIADLAYSWGFRSLSYFGKVFRGRYGITPGEYRVRMANGES